MQIRTGQTGVFLGCSGYGLPKDEKCTQTLPLTPGEEVVEISDDEAQADGSVETCRSPNPTPRKASMSISSIRHEPRWGRRSRTPSVSPERKGVCTYSRPIETPMLYMVVSCFVRSPIPTCEG